MSALVSRQGDGELVSALVSRQGEDELVSALVSRQGDGELVSTLVSRLGEDEVVSALVTHTSACVPDWRCVVILYVDTKSIATCRWGVCRCHL